MSELQYKNAEKKTNGAIFKKLNEFKKKTVKNVKNNNQMTTT
jgi:hypothetical protein